MDDSQTYWLYMNITEIDMIPIFGVVVSIVSIGLKMGKLLQKLDHVIEDVTELKQEVKGLNNRVTILENTTVRVESKN